MLVDLSSSYFGGISFPLARFGYSRDRKQGKLQINYALLCDVEGRPVSVTVFEGNVSDSTTVLPTIEHLRKRFGLTPVVLVGDRGMLVQARIHLLRRLDGMRWISALYGTPIRKVDRSDEEGLFQIFQHPDFPDERLVTCRNPRLAARRTHKRESLLEATERLLAPIRASVEAGRLQGQDQIGLRVGKVVNRYQVGKQFDCQMDDNSFRFPRRQDRIDSEAALDGVYGICTLLSAQDLSAADCVRHYKALT